MPIQILFLSGSFVSASQSWTRSTPAAERQFDGLVCPQPGDFGEITATRDKPKPHGDKSALAAVAIQIADCAHGTNSTRQLEILLQP